MGSSVAHEGELCKLKIAYERHEEHIDEIQLMVPCTITEIHVSDSRPEEKGQSSSVLQAYARDESCAQAARFAPLLTAPLACAAGATQKISTEAVLTSHVVIRGRYSKLWITISGVPDCDDARPPSARSSRDGQDQAAQPPVLPKLPCPRSYTLAGLKRDPEAGLGPLDKGVAAGGLVRPDNLAGPLHTLPLQQTVSLPLPTLPPVYVDALCRALNYCSQVHRSRSAIERKPPQERLMPLMVEAFGVCKALQGDMGDLISAMGEARELPVPEELRDPAWVEAVADMAVSWANLGSSPATFMPAELQVGTAGLAAALLLCLWPETCNVWMAHGGLQSVADYLPLHNLPADMFRMCVCIMELVTVTAGANGCDALLGWWAPPPLPPRAPRFAHPPPPPPPRRDVKREEDDALAAAADAADFAAAATARAFRADGSPQRGGWRADREPSARAAGAAGGDDDTGQDGSSPRVKSEGGGGGVKREPRDSDTHGENAEDHHGDGDGDAQGSEEGEDDHVSEASEREDHGEGDEEDGAGSDDHPLLRDSLYEEDEEHDNNNEHDDNDTNQHDNDTNQHDNDTNQHDNDTNQHDNDDTNQLEDNDDGGNDSQQDNRRSMDRDGEDEPHRQSASPSRSDGPRASDGNRSDSNNNNDMKTDKNSTPASDNDSPMQQQNDGNRETDNDQPQTDSQLQSPDAGGTGGGTRDTTSQGGMSSREEGGTGGGEDGGGTRGTSRDREESVQPESGGHTGGHTKVKREESESGVREETEDTEMRDKERGRKRGRSPSQSGEGHRAERSQDDRDQHQRRRGERDKDVSDRDRNGSDRHNQHPHHGNASNIASDRDRAPLRAGSAAPLPPPPPAALPARTPTRPRGPPTRNTYPLLVRLLMAQERPHGVGAVLVRVLRRLHANELLARLQRAAQQVLHGPTATVGPTPGQPTNDPAATRLASPDMDSTSTRPPPLAPLSAMELVKTLRETAGQLAELGELLLAGPDTPPLLAPGTSVPENELTRLLPPPAGLDSGAMQLLRQRALLTLLPPLVAAGYQGIATLAAAAAAAAPAAARGKSGGSGASAAAQQVQQQLHQLQQVHSQLLSAIRALVTALLSDPQGVTLIQTAVPEVTLLIQTLQPAWADIGVRERGEKDGESSEGDVRNNESGFENGFCGWWLDPDASFGGRDAVMVTGAGGAGTGLQGPRPGLAAAQELAVVLRQALCAQAAVSALADAAAGGGSNAAARASQVAAAVYTLSALAGDVTAAVSCGRGVNTGRAIAARTLTLAPPALHALLRLMRERVRVQRAAAALGDGGSLGAASTGAVPASGGERGGPGGSAGGLLDLDFDDVDLVGLSTGMNTFTMPVAPRYARESLYASSIILQVVRELHPQVLSAWAPFAGAIADAARAEQEALSVGAGSASMIVTAGNAEERARRVLRELQARAEVVALAQDRGMSALLEVLDSNLPRLVTRGTEMAAASVCGLSLLPPTQATATAAAATGVGAPPALGATVSTRDIDVRGLLALCGAHDRLAAATTALSVLAAMLAPAAGAAGKSAGGTASAAIGALVSRDLPSARGETPEGSAAASLGAAAAARRQLAMQVYARDGVAVLERAVRTAAAALAATASDASWAAATGDDLDTLTRVRNEVGCVGLATSVASFASALLTVLAASGMRVSSAGLLDGLLKLHAGLCVRPECQAAVLASMNVPPPTARARQQVAKCLGTWLDNGWSPPVVHTALGVQPGPKFKLDLSDRSADTPLAAQTGSAASGGASTALTLCPAETYAAMCLLGDLMPPEWPQPPQGAGGAAPAGGKSPPTSLPPPSMPARRTALLAALAACEGPLRRLLSFAAVCESRAVRHAAVRVVVGAASLGPSMPTFCAQPLLEPLTAAAKAAPGSPPISDSVRRVLEMVVPLSAKPAVKAGLLELRLAGVLARIVHNLITRMVDEAPEGSAALSMCLEALLVLANPDVALQPSLSRDKRLAEDVPPLADLTTVVTALLAALQHLSKEVPFVRQLLVAAPAGLATHALGRQAIRQGVLKWHVSQVGGGAAGLAAAANDPAALAAALTWAAARTRDVGERAAAAAGGGGASGAASLPALAAELSQLLGRLAENPRDAAADAKAVADAATATPQSAAARFTAALDAAGAAAAGSTTAPFGPLLVTDGITNTFWKYVRMRGARVVGAVPLKKLSKWDLPEPGTGGPSKPDSSSDKAAAATLVVAKLFVEGLTKRKRARVERTVAATTAMARLQARASASAAGAGTGAGPRKDTGSSGGGADDSKVTRPGASGAQGGLKDTSPPPNAASNTAHPDIPVVTAPRRTGPPRRQGGGSSRPPSLHVDDYERPRNQAPKSHHASQPSPRGPPPQGVGLPGPPPQPGHMGPMGGPGPGPQRNLPPPPLMNNTQPQMSASMSFNPDSLYDDLFPSGPGGGGSGNVSRQQSVTHSSGPNQQGGGGRGGGPMGRGGRGGGGGPPPPRAQPPPQSLLAPPPMQQQPSFKPQDDASLYDDIYGDMGGGGGGGGGGSGGGSLPAPTGGTGLPENWTEDQIKALLANPAEFQAAARRYPMLTEIVERLIKTSQR